MKIFKYFGNNSEYIQNIKPVMDTLPSIKDISNELFEMVGNKTTTIKLDGEIKNSYYVYLTDTIYLSDNKKSRDSVERVVLLCHEIIHSIQNKTLQAINFILSNLEILLFVIFAMLLFFCRSYIIPTIFVTISVAAMLFRIYLEVGATEGSLKLCRKYLTKRIGHDDVDKVLEMYRHKINILYPFFIFGLTFGRITRLLIIVVLYIFMK